MTAYAEQRGCAGDLRRDLSDLAITIRNMTGGHRGHRGPGGPGGPGGGPGNFGFGPFGFGGFGGPGGPGGPGPWGPWRRHMRKARRGDIRIAALMLLAEEPRNGYQIMQEIQQRSEGVWSPSPGSVYPALAQLEDEGLIHSHESEGRKHFHITDAGSAVLAERPEDARAPWDEATQGLSEQAMELGALMREVAMAFVQVMRVGGERQIAEAKKVLSQARRALYRILAEGDEGDQGDEPEARSDEPQDA